MVRLLLSRFSGARFSGALLLTGSVIDGLSHHRLGSNSLSVRFHNLGLGSGSGRRGACSGSAKGESIAATSIAGVASSGATSTAFTTSGACSTAGTSFRGLTRFDSVASLPIVVGAIVVATIRSTGGGVLAGTNT